METKVDWFECVRKNKDIESSGLNNDFIYFFDKFRKAVADSSILLVGTGSTELMFTEWPRILKVLGAKNITYLELFDGYISKFSNREYKIVKGDVKKIDEYFEKNKFDIVCWFHGPEHIKQKEMPQTFSKIKGLVSKGLVSICPFGSYYADAGTEENVYELHLQPDMVVSDFDSVVGLDFFSVGEKDTADAVIIGYYFGGIYG